jgi:hypothetical protein
MIGAAWAAVWIPIGVIVAARRGATELDPEHIAGPLYAGFLCGAMFAGLAGIAAGRRLDELSPFRAAGWGAASGVFVGVLPFVIGDNGRYQNGWATLVAVTAAIAAGTIARRWFGKGWFVRAATFAAALSGFAAGPLQWSLTTEGSIERWIPAAVIVGMTALSASSGFVSSWLARRLAHHDAPLTTRP